MQISRERVEILMAERQINPKELVHAAGISYPTLGRAYVGKSKPVTVGRIARALGVDVVDILREVEIKEE